MRDWRRSKVLSRVPRDILNIEVDVEVCIFSPPPTICNTTTMDQSLHNVPTAEPIKTPPPENENLSFQSEAWNQSRMGSPQSNSRRKLIDFTVRAAVGPDQDQNQEPCTKTQDIDYKKELVKQMLRKYDKSVPEDPVRFPSFRSLDKSSFFFEKCDNNDEERVEFILKVEPREKRLERSSSKPRRELITEISKLESKLRVHKGRPRSKSID